MPKIDTKGLIFTGFLFSSLYYLSNFAFSSDIRQLILERDNFTCVNSSEECEGMLHASHINHDKSKSSYNAPWNGRTQCVAHHLKYHEATHGRNGITKSQNSWAIERLKEAIGRK